MFRSTLLTVLQNGKWEKWWSTQQLDKKKVQDFIPFFLFFLWCNCISHFIILHLSQIGVFQKKKKVWLWKHAESLQNARTWVHLHVVSGPRTVQIPLFKAKLAEQVKKFAHPTTGSQQQPQVRCSLKLGRKKRLSVPLLCYSVLRRFWPDGLSNHIHPNHDMIRDTIPL